MFKHASSTARITMAMIMALSLTVQAFPVTRSRIVFRVNPEKQTNPQAKKSSAPALAVATPPAIVVPPSGPLAVGPIITATNRDLPGTTANTGDTITYNVVVTNSGTTDATGVNFTDVINPDTATLVGGSAGIDVRANADTYSSIGNVGINSANLTGCPSTNTCHSVTGNDTVNSATLTGFGNSLANANVTAPNGTNTVTTTNSGTVKLNADGTFTYDPAAGFTGTDTFWYTLTKGSNLNIAQVTITVTTPIWFINAGAGGTNTGTLANPFNGLTGGAGTFSNVNDGVGLHPADNHTIFMYSGAYTGGLTLRNGQKLVGQGATATLASIVVVTPSTESNALPATGGANPVVTSAANGINLGVGFSNTLRGFTIGNTTGAKIASGASFGTLTVGNNTTPDMLLNGTGQALNLTSGAFAATSGFTSVTSTSSGTQGINLAGITGTASFGSTTISGNTTQCILIGTTTANINFGNTSCTGGTDGVSFQNNSAGTRTFGTLGVSGGSGNAFLHGASGGNVTITGAATLSSAGSAVSVSGPGATNVIDFQGATSATSTGAANTGVNWVGTAGATLTFNSLTIQTNGGTGLNATTGGTVNVTNGTGTVNNTVQAAAAIIASSVALNANFSAIKSSGGTNGVSLTTVTGTSNFGGGTLSGASGATFNVSGGTASVTYSGAITQATASQAMVSVAGGHSGTLTFNTGTLSATNGTGLQFDNADGTYNFNGTTTLNGGDAGVDILNGSGGTFSFTSGATITNPTGTAFTVNGSTAGVTYSGGMSKSSAGLLVDITNEASGTITFNTGTLSATGGTGIQLSNADNTVNFNGTTTLNGGDAGVDIITGCAGTITFAAGTTITNPSGIAYREDTSTANVTYNGTISQTNTANAVSINAKTGGTTTFNGSITASTTTANAITLTSNTLGTITFNGSTSTGGLNLTTTSGVGFNATGGGTVNVTQNNTTIVNTITSTTGTALNVANTTIGASGLTFRSISSNGAANGINMLNTGAGGFTVTGNGSTCTVATATCDGGSIQSSTGQGILLNKVGPVSLTRIKVQNSGNRSVGTPAQTAGDTCAGACINGFTMDNSIITDSVGGAADDGLVLTNVTGAVSVTNSAISNIPHNGMWVDNFSFNMSSFTMTNTTISCAAGQICHPATVGTVGNDGLLLVIRGTSVLTSGSITSSTFTGHRALGVQVQTGDTGRIGSNSGGVITAPAASNSITIGGVGVGNTCTGNGQGIDVDTSQLSNMSFQILNNTVVGIVTAPGVGTPLSSATAINAFTAAGAATGPTAHTFVGKIDGNIIGTTGVKDSGAGFGAGIRVVVQGVATAGVVSVTNNTIREVPNADIMIFFGQNGAAASPSASARYKITGNTIVAATGSNLDVCGPVDSPCPGNGIFVLADEGSAVCNAITGNTVPDQSAGGFDIYLAERAGPPAGAQLTVEGTGSVSAFVQANNTLAGASKFLDEGANTSLVAPGGCGSFPAIAQPDDNLGVIIAPPAASQTAKADVPSLTNVTGSAVGLGSADNSVDSATVASAHVTSTTSNESLARQNEVRNNSSVAAMKPRPEVRDQRSARANHATQTQAQTPSHTQAKSPPTAADKGITPAFGGTVNLSLGTIPAGSSVSLTFQVTINTAQPLPHTSISNQGTVSGGNFTLVNGISTTPNTDDPDTGAAADPTVTNLVQPTASNGTVSGQILDGDGNPVEGAGVRMSGTQNRMVVTDAQGNYRFDNVETNGFYTVTPSRANFIFSPAQRSFSQIGQNTNAVFGATTTGNALNPLDTTEYFVRQQYVDFLGREPDEAGLNFWYQNIESCGDDANCRAVKRIDTSAAFFLSIEFNQTGYLVYRTYQAAFGDMANAPVPLTFGQFKPDTAAIGNGVIVNQGDWQTTLNTNKQAFMAEFVQRSRFTTAYPAGLSPTAFVDQLFANAGVIPADSDRAAAIAEFGSASTSSDVAARGRALRLVAENSVLAQQEFNQAFVLMQYFGYLRRDPNTGPDTDFAGYNFWLNKLVTFNGNFGDAEMVKSFLLAGEYRGRFPR